MRFLLDSLFFAGFCIKGLPVYAQEYSSTNIRLTSLAESIVTKTQKRVRISVMERVGKQPPVLPIR